MLDPKEFNKDKVAELYERERTDSGLCKCSNIIYMIISLCFTFHCVKYVSIENTFNRHVILDYVTVRKLNED